MAMRTNDKVKGRTMRLSSEQIERFYRIWFALLRFVNDQRQLISDFPVSGEEGALPPPDEMELRNALWADETLLERFIAANPAGLSSADLAMVESWRRYRIAGGFYILRALKAYTVFLSDRAPQHAYGVLGLLRPIEEVAPMPLPLYSEVVLLPFEGQIIYDGMLHSYAVSLGPNIRRRLNETYRNAQEREGIITSLVPVDTSVSEQRTLIESRNAKLLQAFRQHLTKAGLSLKMVEQHAGNIEAFAQAVLVKQDPPQGLLEITLAELQAYLLTAKTKSTPISFKRFVRFLAETGRMEFEEAQTLLQVLKQA
jgi:hypothetical protein